MVPLLALLDGARLVWRRRFAYFAYFAYCWSRFGHWLQLVQKTPGLILGQFDQRPGWVLIELSERVAGANPVTHAYAPVACTMPLLPS